MSRGNALHNAQAQPRTSFGAGTALVNAVEGIEDTRKVLGRDANSTVSHRHLDSRVRFGRFVDYTTVRRVIDRVVQQVLEHLTETSWFDQDNRLATAPYRESVILGIGKRLHDFHGVLGKLDEIHWIAPTG